MKFRQRRILVAPIDLDTRGQPHRIAVSDAPRRKETSIVRSSYVSQQDLEYFQGKSQTHSKTKVSAPKLKWDLRLQTRYATKLCQQGVVIEDTAVGTMWRAASSSGHLF